MAPTITAAMTNSQEHLALNHKLRKPLVERLRRERINSSIEQLRSLLGPEFLNQQPESKLEKADILERTVCLLRRLQQQQQQQQHPDVNSGAGDLGYSRCVQEVMHFMSKDEVTTPFLRRHLNPFSMTQSFSENNVRKADVSPLSSAGQSFISEDKNPAHSALWRPW